MTFYNITSSEVTEDESDKFVIKIVVGIALSLIIFMAIAGNLLVCLAVYTEKSLRKLGNLFIVSLAIADLLVGILVGTFALCNDLMGYWAFGSQFCDIWMSCDVMCSTASILNLCAISLDRYIHINDPLRYSRWMSRRVVLLTIALLWFISGLVSFLPISLGLQKPESDDPYSPSDLPSCILDLTPTYAILSSCISFYFPCIVMVALYTRLYRCAKKHVKMIKSMTKPTFGTVDGKVMSPPPRYPVSEHKAAITVGVVMGVFLLCFLPFFLINIVDAFCKACIPDIVFKALTWLGYFNSAMNPIIYSIFNVEFREAFQKILTGRCRYCGYTPVSTFHSYRDNDSCLNHSVEHAHVLKSKSGCKSLIDGVLLNSNQNSTVTTV